MLESLLINFLFLLFPVLVFLIFFENRIRYFSHPILILLSAVTMVLCMSFPIRLDSGFIFDLRYIPFLIVALFGGYRSCFPLFVVLNIYRLFIGGQGVVQSFEFSAAVFVAAPLASRMFLKQNARKQTIMAAFIAFMTMAFYLFTMSLILPKLNREFWILTFNAVFTYTTVMAVIIILIEQIIANIKARRLVMQSEKLNVMSDLSASVSHEIRNPLTVTNGFLQLLKKSATISDQDRHYVELSLLELNRAEKIVSDFLAFAKPQSENMIFSNLKDEAEYVRNIITPYANMHRVAIEYHFDNTLNFHYDKNQMQQCLINLYKNAIEAMREKGGTLSIHISQDKKDIAIRIKDTGVGMTKEEILQLGSPYYSTKKEGTGLGMLMVYSTVNKVKGKIDVESEKGKGTTFFISIPEMKKSQKIT